MRIVRKAVPCAPKPPTFSQISPGAAFEYNSDLYIRVNHMNGQWNLHSRGIPVDNLKEGLAINATNGCLCYFNLDTEVTHFNCFLSEVI